MANYVQLQSGIVISEAQFAEKTGRRPTFDEIATSQDGRDITRGYIPDNMLLAAGDTVLSGKGGGDYKIYEDISRDDQVITCRQQRQLALIAKEWGVDPGDNSRKAKRAADHLRDVLTHIQFDDKTQKMLSAVLYGFAVAEIMWMSDGNSISIDTIKVRNRSRFGFLPSGELRMKTLNDTISGEKLPTGKFWAFACGADHDDEHYGLGLGHYLYWPVFFKRNGIKFWLYFLEKFGQPTALGKYPPNASPAEKNRLLEALRAIKTDSAIRIPEGMQVELIEAARSGTADYTSLVTHMNAAISKVYLGHTGSTDATPGRLGGEDNASEVREDFIKADADLICHSFNCTVARWLTHYNDPSAPPPRVWRKVEPPEDLKHRADIDKLIFDMGFKPILKYIQDSYHGDYEEIKTPDNGLPGIDNGSNAENTEPEDNPALFGEGDDLADPPGEMTALLGKTAEPAIDAMLDAVRGLLETSETLQEVQEGLADLFPVMDSSEFAIVLSQALLSANLAGRDDLEENR